MPKAVMINNALFDKWSTKKEQFLDQDEDGVEATSSKRDGNTHDKKSLEDIGDLPSYKKDIPPLQILHNNQYQYPRLNLACHKGYFAYYNALDDSKFALCVSTTWQQTFFAQADGVCLDATHDVTGKKFIMYTIVTQHEDIWRGFPIAYLVTDSQASSPLTSWLRILCQKGVESTISNHRLQFDGGQSLATCLGKSNQDQVLCLEQQHILDQVFNRCRDKRVAETCKRPDEGERKVAERALGLSPETSSPWGRQHEHHMLTLGTAN
ncbi:predicted protein [Lichtheimia corymbifera JMRC:FSU:9682]|uniref:MULE transposase domain-containing protein n=1 Tax=Lichtheimia corymbifera JMRC:FSU:9682 TaxID=1263082 RepID=A0A068SF94_9FUNG|nr:predicted protein [Lichtheimia corymbifera JMRC:FSU:9682]